MKKIYWLAFFSVLSYSAIGQKSKIVAADNYYTNFQYRAAAQAYEQVYRTDSGNKAVKEKLFLCYTKLNDSQKASFWLGNVLKDQAADSKYYKTYATLLAANSRYNEASEWFGKSYESTQDKESLHWLNAYKNLSAFYEDSALYQVGTVAFNSPYSDFSPAFYGDGLVFCSARISGKTSATKNTPYAAGFVDLYYAPGANSKPELFSSRLNSTYHEGPLAFTTNQDTVYFTRSNFLQKKLFSNDGVNKLKIYYAAVKEGKWGKIHDFELNNNEYSVGHPALASSTVMYFASDMPGGYGGTDLYKTEKVNGTWQKPVNLGPDINTSGNEMFPYVDEQGILYFASNGHPGLGGLDIFYTPTSGNPFGQVANMGAPVNTSRDDFGLIVKNTTGYFSSNRNGDISNDNIYRLTINRTKLIYIQTLDESGKPLPEVDLALSLASAQEGTKLKLSGIPLKINWEYGKLTKMQFSKEGFKSQELNFAKADYFKYKANDTLTVKLVKKVTPKEEKIFQIVLMDELEEVLIGGQVELTDIASGLKRTFTIKEKGVLKVKLAPGKSFTLRGFLKGYNDGIRTLSAEELAEAPSGQRFVIQLLAQQQVNVLPANELFNATEVGQMIELGIKYDVNKADIRPDVAPKLDKLVGFMQKYPNIKIELGSHTDSRGSAVYNQELSQKRAESAVRYVTSKGISPDRIVAVGYGKNNMKVPDAKIESEHQQNRRTTVRIIGN